MTPFDLARFGGEPKRLRCNAEQTRRLVQIKPWLVPVWRRPKDRDLMMRPERGDPLRSHHKIPVFRPAPDGNEPWLNLNKAAGLLGIAPKTLRLAAEAGEIEASHPLPDGPWIFSRSTLGEPAAQRVVRRARQNPNHPTESHPDQQNLFSPIT